jgi:hypothetical protein
MNDKQIQPLNNNSQYCGWICLMFLDYMNKHYEKKLNNSMTIFYNFIKLFNYKKINDNKKIIFNYFNDIINK